MSTPEELAQRQEVATVKVETAAHILDRVGNGTKTEIVQTANGPVPSVLKFMEDNKVQIAAASGAADRFCGVSDVPPTSRLGGGSLQKFDEWGNSADSMPYYWNGSDWVALHNIAINFPFSFVEGQAQYDVGLISGDPAVTTEGLALWVEGTRVYDFTVNDSKKFTLNDVAHYADGAQMRIIVNANFSSIDMSLRRDLAGTGGSNEVGTLLPDGTEGTVLDGLYYSLFGNMTFTVGDGGHYLKLSEALRDVHVRFGNRRASGAKITLRLQPGFVMTEQIEIDSVDLSYITLLSTDAEVMVDGSAMTKKYRASFYYLYMFLIANNGISPAIGVQFVRLSGDGLVGFYVAHDSKCIMLNKSGARSFFKGAHLSHKSLITLRNIMVEGVAPTAEMYGCDFSLATRRGVDGYHKCDVNLPASYFNGCTGDYGTFLIWNSNGNFKMSNASDSAGAGFAIRDGGTMCVRDITAENCDYGIYAIHGAWLDARSHGGSEPSAGDDGFATSVNVRGCRIGIHMNGSVHMEAVSIDARNCTQRAFRITRSSTCNAAFADASGSLAVAELDELSTLNLADATMLDINSTVILLAKNNSTICATRAVITGALETTAHVINCEAQSSINLANANINVKGVIRCAGQQGINLDYATVTCNGTIAQTGASLGMRSTILTVPGESSRHVTVLQGSFAYCAGMNTGAAARRLSQPADTLTSAGIIFG